MKIRTLLIWTLSMMVSTGIYAQWTVNLSPVAGYYRIDAVHFLDNTTGFTGGTNLLFGGDGVISKTTNGGNSWTNVASITGSPITAIQFVNTNLGFAVGTNGLIAKTTDGGNTWSSQNYTNPNSGNNEDFQGVHFLDQNTGYVAGGTFEMLVLKTTDGGDTWTQLTLPAYFQRLKSVHFLSTTEGFVVGGDQFNGGQGRIYHTTDGGNSWNEIPSGVTNYFNDIHFTDASNGFIGCASNGVLLKTSDGGQTWNSVSNPSGGSALGEFSFVNANLGYVCTLGGQILKTTDGGANWTLDEDVSGTIFSLYSISVPSANFGVAAGLSPLFAKLGSGPSVGIDQQEALIANTIRISPNPSNGQLSIEALVQTRQEAVVSVVDLQGKTMFSSEWNSNEILNLDLGNLPNGVYLVHYLSAKAQSVEKLIIAK
ncbi:MAG: YCF48-related protein [Salibacteraceae bacterium]